MAWLVKNPPTMQETWVRFLGWDDPLGKGKATHSSVLAWRIPWTIQSDMTEQLSLSPLFHFSVPPGKPLNTLKAEYYVLVYRNIIRQNYHIPGT